MSEFLYERFLEDRRVYHAARAFWFKQVKRLFPNKEPLEPYLAERFENGELFYDGNPIINVINLRTSKCARVIQESPAKFEKFYTSWEHETSLTIGSAGTTVPLQEKVIVLTLTRDALQKSKDELRGWLRDG
jgi:hypothetical protein